MWTSLLKLRSLPDDTLVYCGHEYTLSNAKFCSHLDPDNKFLKTAYTKIKSLRERGLPTIPFELGKEKQINPFLRADQKEFTNSIGLKSNHAYESFGAIRQQKDNF